MRRFCLYLFVCSAVVLLAGCKVKRPSDVLPESTMEQLLYDYHIAKSLGENLPNENYKRALYLESVFRKYGTTEAEFDSSMVWYTRNTEILTKIYEKVSKRLKDEQELVNDLVAKRDKKPKTTPKGDSIDVWPWQRMVRLTGKMMGNLYSFSIPADSNYSDRDTLVWEVRYRFLEPLLPDSLRSVVMGMQVLYEKDTLSDWKLFSVPGLVRIRLNADTLGKMREIRGFISYDSKDNGKAHGALLADRFSMMRYHCQDSLPFAMRDSLNRVEKALEDSLSADTASQKVIKELKQDASENRRLTPDMMNKKRTGAQPAKRPEQVEVERHIQQERLERQRMLRRRQQLQSR